MNKLSIYKCQIKIINEYPFFWLKQEFSFCAGCRSSYGMW